VDIAQLFARSDSDCCVRRPPEIDLFPRRSSGARGHVRAPLMARYKPPRVCPVKGGKPVAPYLSGIRVTAVPSDALVCARSGVPSGAVIGAIATTGLCKGEARCVAIGSRRPRGRRAQGRRQPPTRCGEDPRSIPRRSAACVVRSSATRRRECSTLAVTAWCGQRRARAGQAIRPRFATQQAATTPHPRQTACAAGSSGFRQPMSLAPSAHRPGLGRSGPPTAGTRTPVG
jgi:hypothetical protein